MTEERTRQIHDLDVTIWVGKRGLDPVVEELATQLDDHDLVKVKFLKAARTSETTEQLAVSLADSVGCEVVQTRGHTAVFAP